MRHPLPLHALRRRTALLGAAGLLAGCETVSDLSDALLGTSDPPLPGERRPVLAAGSMVTTDEGARTRAFSLPEPQPNEAWPTAGGPPDHAPGHLVLGRPLAEAWRASIGSGNGFRQRLTAPPVVAGGTVFAMDAFGWVTALDARRGGQRWQVDTRAERDRAGALGGALAFGEGALYVATGLAEVMALDPATGAIRWRARMPAPARGGLAVAGDRVLVPNVENQLVAFSAEDGRRLWTFRGTPVPALLLGQPSPALEDDIAVAGFGSGEIVALRVADGRVLWNESLGQVRGGGASLADITAIAGLPVIDRGRVLASGLGGTSVALDLRSGRRIWEREVGGGTTPAVAGDWVFILSRENELVCLGRDDGRARWIEALPAFRDPDRRRDPIRYGPPVLAGGRLLVASSEAQMLELDPGTGIVQGRLRLPDAVTLQPAIAGGVAYLLTEGGSVVALGAAG